MAKTPIIFEEPLSRDEAVKQLADFFKDGQGALEEAIMSSMTLSPAEKARKIERIRGITAELLVGSRRWVEINVPATYKEGAEFVIKKMEAQGITPKVTEGFNELHKEAVQALSDGVYTTLQTSLVSLEKRTINTLLQAYNINVENELLGMFTKGETRKEVSKFLVDRFEKNGVTMIVDRGGRKWNMEAYARMVARTSRADVFNNAVANRALENGFDLVQVTAHQSKHEACRIWENKVLSLTGVTKGYPTLDDAKAAGLFHPNCMHTYTAITQEEANDLE